MTTNERTTTDMSATERKTNAEVYRVSAKLTSYSTHPHSFGNFDVEPAPTPNGLRVKVTPAGGNPLYLTAREAEAWLGGYIAGYKASAIRQTARRAT